MLAILSEEVCFILITDLSYTPLAILDVGKESVFLKKIFSTWPKKSYLTETTAMSLTRASLQKSTTSSVAGGLVRGMLPGKVSLWDRRWVILE